MIRAIAVFFLNLCSVTSAMAQIALPENESIWSNKSQSWMSLEQFRAEIAPGDVLVMGEQHAIDESLSNRVHHSNQLRLLQSLSMAQKVSLGMEFFTYTAQNALDLYVMGQMSEKDFLQAVNWGGNAFALYRPQLFVPQTTGGRTLAMNISRDISGKVARLGPNSLTSEEKALLPPIWERGSAPYFERFSEAMEGHMAPEKLERYFLAQSLWDDTMAWRAFEHRRLQQDDVLVVIVGSFHAEYGLGLPARMKRHGVKAVKTMVQAEVENWTAETLDEAVAGDSNYGALADFVWVYKLPAKESLFPPNSKASLR